MEYYIFVTKACNLDCRYCYIKELGSSRKTPNYDLSKLIDFILLTSKKFSIEPVAIFYGGEPLLYQSFIKRFIELSRGTGIRYILHTNGLLLDKIDNYLLTNLNKIFVSIDGDKKIHDQFRGYGTFEKIIRNVQRIRSKFDGEILARITLPICQTCSLYNSVLNIVDLFDGLFWQIENLLKPKDTTTLNIFKKNYSHDLCRLVDYWIKNIENGIPKNIIPLRVVLNSLIFKKEHKFLRCGFGTNIVAIDTDGRCYYCDEFLGNENFKLGDIENGITFNKEITCDKLNSCCSSCEIRNVCAGRCVRSLLFSSPEVFSFYCECTKMLVKCLDKIKGRDLLEKGKITKDWLETPCYNEEIP